MRWSGLTIPMLLATAATAQPGLVLDDFDSAINDEIGGARQVSLEVLANPFSQLTKFEVSPGYTFAAVTGAAVFNSGLAAQQVGTLAWDNGGAGLGLDATGFTGFELDFLQADQSFGLSIRLESFSTGGSADWSGIVGATSTGETLSALFEDFVVSGEFDPGDVDSVTMRFNVGESPTSSLDFVLTEFRAGGVIPAPGAVALAGLSGLVLSRRRRR